MSSTVAAVIAFYLTTSAAAFAAPGEERAQRVAPVATGDVNRLAKGPAKDAAKKLPATIRVELDSDKTENPRIIEVGENVANTSTTSSPFSKCRNASDSYYTASPVITLEVKSKVKLQIFSVEAGLLSYPNNTHRCWEHRSIGNPPPIHITTEEFPPGIYKFHAMARKGNTQAMKLRIVLVDRIAADVNGRLDAAAAIEIKGGEPTNPLYFPVDPQVSVPFPAAQLKVSCARRNLVPVSRVKIGSSSTYQFSAAKKRKLFLVDASGKCIKGGGDMKKGDYTLYAEAKNDKGPDAIAVADMERKFAFADAPTLKVGKLTKPLETKITVGAPASRHALLCGSGAHAPSFYLDAKKEIMKASLKTLSSSGDVNITIAGPLDAKKRGRSWCGAGRVENMKGKYAVWVTGDEAAAGKPAWVALRARFSKKVKNYKAKGNPYASPEKAPKDLSIAARKIWFHFPYHDVKTTAVEDLFLKAPLQLFVFLDRDAHDLRAGEPFLVDNYGAEKSSVLRANGERHTVRTERLTIERPDKVLAPDTWPTIKKPQKLKEAYRINIPSDGLALAKWEEKDAKVYSCVAKWMKKNDPTWGKNYELVNTRTGETVSSRKFKKADRVCKAKAVERAAKKLTSAIYKKRKKAQKNVKKKLVKRFK